MVLTIDEILHKLHEVLPAKRFRHSLGVAYTAASIAMCYQYPQTDQIVIAGLLHDCAKYLKDTEILMECKNHQLAITAVEERNPHLLHGKLGAYLAVSEYGITDPEILSAITWHTTGRPDMSFIEKVIFLCDYIEPNRTQHTEPSLSLIRETAFHDIDLAITMTLISTLSYLSGTSREIDPQTQLTYEFYSALKAWRGAPNNEK